MMNYEIFKEVVVEKFKDYLPKEYQRMELSVRPIDKVNVTLDRRKSLVKSTAKRNCKW